MNRSLTVDQLLDKYQQTNEIRYFFEAFNKFTKYALDNYGTLLKPKGNFSKKDISNVPFTAWRSNYASYIDQRHIDAWGFREQLKTAIDNGNSLSHVSSRFNLNKDQIFTLLKV